MRNNLRCLNRHLPSPLREKLGEDWIERYTVLAAAAGHAPAAEAGRREAGVAKHPARALEWLSAAARQGHKLAQYRVGVMHEAGLGGLAADEAKALRWYRRAAAQGVKEAPAKVDRAALVAALKSTTTSARRAGSMRHGLDDRPKVLTSRCLVSSTTAFAAVSPMVTRIVLRRSYARVHWSDGSSFLAMARFTVSAVIRS